MVFDTLRRWLGLGAPPPPGSPGEASPSDEMASCEEALARIYEFLDGELAEGWEERVREHFEICKRCYPHLACERNFRVALRRAVGNERAPDAVRERLAAVLAEVSDPD